MFRVDLNPSLDAGKEVTVDVETVFPHTLHPYPSQISQAEKQLVKFIGNVYHFSPYRTTTETTVVNCASSSVDFYTKEKPSSLSDKIITYGPYNNVDAFKTVSSFLISPQYNVFFLFSLQ